jgi:hypothetical protein
MKVKFETKNILDRIVKTSTMRDGATYRVTGVWLDEQPAGIHNPITTIERCDSFGRPLEGNMIIVPLNELIFQ